MTIILQECINESEVDEIPGKEFKTIIIKMISKIKKGHM
jgi:hypothetical protein